VCQKYNTEQKREGIDCKKDWICIIGRYRVKSFMEKFFWRYVDEDEERPSTPRGWHESEVASWRVVLEDNGCGSKMGGVKLSKTRGGVRNHGRVWNDGHERKEMQGKRDGYETTCATTVRL